MNKDQRIKGELTFRVLEALEYAACGISNLLFIFTLPYGTSMGKVLRELDRRQQKRKSWAEKVHTKLQERQRLHNIIYQLRKDQLIEGSAKNKFRVTEKGRRILQKLRRRKQNAFPQSVYTTQPGSLWYVVIFDIPEKERRKRAWLRSALQHLKFKMIQKSVWVGKTKLPKEFLEDLTMLKLLTYVHIFAIHKLGSLSEVIDTEKPRR